MSVGNDRFCSDECEGYPKFGTSYVVRLAQWKNKMVIFNGIVFFLNRDSCELGGDHSFLQWKT